MTAHLTEPLRLDMSPEPTPEPNPELLPAGLPCGVSIVGPVHRDADILHLARQLSETQLHQRKMTMLKRLKSAEQARLHLILMLVLTFSTGVIDAVGYLGLDRVFAGNMTGNVVILGMALIGADNLSVIGPSIALAGFMLGAVIAGRALRPEAAGWSRRTTALLTAVGVTMTAVAVVLLFHAPHAGDPVTLAITGALAIAMGIQAATARHLSVKDVTTVVVTSTLTGLAADSRFGGGSGKHAGRRLGAVVLILAGAATGAALLQVHAGYGILLTALLTAGVALAGGAARNRTPGSPAPAAAATSQHQVPA